MRKKIVVKVGTATLTTAENKISYAKIEDIARQLINLKKDYDVILVSSAAIAAAKQFININGHSTEIGSKQAMAAIGQPKLMRIYDEVFGSFGLKVAQCLMTYRDFENESSKINTKNTINTLLEYDYIPIINENDTVSVEEIMLGDNDKLSALVAGIMQVDLLIVASDIDGLYDKNPHLTEDAKLITEVLDLEKISSCIEEKKSGVGTGGMSSKIEAAQICQKNGIEMWIVNGQKDNFILNSMQGSIPFTKIKS